jgi:sulfatase maturation enzyme AslB (radical SAM superfamily)
MSRAETYCVMPHIGLSIQNHGDVCVCNKNDLSLKTAQDEVIFLNKNSLGDSWSSPTRKYISELTDSGQGMPLTKSNHGCQDCYDSEKANIISQRQQLNSSFKDLIPSDTQPRVLIIKPGNVCNLACRMCNPATSSYWYNDAYKLAVKYEGVTGSLAKWTKNFEHIKDGFHDTNDKLWPDLTKWLPELVFLDIYGGEPFLITALFKSLGKVADDGNSKNTSLQLHTNLTIYNEKYLDILSQYKTVNLGLSIDSHDPKQLNYIRYPVDPDVILTNLRKFRDFFIGQQHVNLNITLTVNSLNVYDLADIYEELSKYNLSVALNFVNWPIEYDVRTLPDDVKKIIAEKSDPKLTSYLLQDIEGAGEHFKKFWQTTNDLDQFRNQDFKLVFPEYYEILTPYLP